MSMCILKISTLDNTTTFASVYIRSKIMVKYVDWTN